MVGNHEGISILANPRQFATLGTLLNELFTHTMANFVAPYSYGAEWLIIGEPFSKSVIAPIEWVENPGRPISGMAPDWVVSMRPAESWIVPRSHWEIVVGEPKGRGGLNLMEYIKTRAYGVVTNNDRVAAALKMNAKAIAFLRKRFRTGTVATAKKFGYRHSLVFSDWLNTGLVGKIAIDSDEELSDDIERFLRW